MWLVATLMALCGYGIGLTVSRNRRRRLEAQLASANRRHQNELMESKATLERERREREAIFDAMVEGVLLLDGAGRILLVNKALRGLFGLTEDVRGRTVLEAFRLHEVHELALRLSSEVRAQGVELELPGLKPRFILVNAASLGVEQGERGGTILIFHDQTRIRLLEDTRKEFVANVSHELRTPLSLIKGYVETLIDGAKEDPDLLVRFLQTIDKHADRLAFLIEDLLTISRLESGQVVLNLRPCAPREVVDQVAADLATKSASKGIRLINEIPAGLMVVADADRLQQVFANLVDNAIKYGKNNGMVHISATERPDSMVELGVSDNGPGIPAEALERVFERFYRVDRARSREAGGTGLGLAIVKHIVQSHGGDVWAVSQVGAGASFRFTLPKP